MIAQGGRAVYGETVGILVLDTIFPRIHGDVANARTFGFPVRYKIVSEATISEVVADADRARRLLPAFIAAARALEAEGVSAIATTCGFLAVVQEEIAAAVSIPVVTSSLFLAPLVLTMTAGRPIGIVTAHAGRLSPAHLRAAGIRETDDFHLRGMEASAAFSSAILAASAREPLLDVEAVAKDVTEVCVALQREQPDLAAILFECTNLQPYAAAAQAATGLPIFGIYHLVQMLHGAARAPRFDGEI